MDNNAGVFQAFFQLVKDVLLSLDAEGRVEFINPAGADLVGWASDQLVGLSWIEHCVPVDSRDVVQHIFNQLLSGVSLELEYQFPIMSRDGLRREMTWTSQLRRDGNGLAEGIYWVGTDITRRIEAESIEQATAAKYAAIVETAADAIITSDSLGIITSFNKAAERYFGYQREEVIGKNIALLTSEQHHNQHNQYIKNYLKTGVKKIIGIGREVVGRRKDGSEFPIELAITEAKMGSDRIFAAIMRDITERKQAAAQLMSRSQELQQLQDQLLHIDRLHIVDGMASGIAHEINQPLTAIINYASSGIRLIREDRGDSENVLDIIVRIDHQARRAADIVRMLRSMIKKRPANYECVDLTQLIGEAIELLKLLNAGARDVTIHTHWSATPVQVEADAVQLQQVIINLINNSLDALHAAHVEAKTIDLTLIMVEQKKVRLSIRDNGPGVAVEDRLRLFEPFFSTKMDGLGLGLSICRSVAFEHGGELFYNAECQQGAEFLFELPLLATQ